MQLSLFILAGLCFTLAYALTLAKAAAKPTPKQHEEDVCSDQ